MALASRTYCKFFLLIPCLIFIPTLHPIAQALIDPDEHIGHTFIALLFITTNYRRQHLVNNPSKLSCRECSIVPSTAKTKPTNRPCQQLLLCPLFGNTSVLLNQLLERQVVCSQDLIHLGLVLVQEKCWPGFCCLFVQGQSVLVICIIHTIWLAFS